MDNHLPQYIWVVFCSEDKQFSVQLEWKENMTALDAVMLSGLSGHTNLPDPLQLGIYSLKIENPAEYLLTAGDRVEIYRPLKLNPKEVRRRRAEKNPVGRFNRGNQWKKQQKSIE